MLKRLLRLTSIARLIDLRVVSNRQVALGSLAVAAAAGGYSLTHGESISQAVGLAVEAGLSVFLGWAIARELDPDNPRSALIALILAAMILLTEGRPYLPGVLGILLAARILVRSTGRPPTVIDLGILVALAAFGARSPEGVPTGLALGAALILDTRLVDPAPRRSLVAGVLALGSTLVAGTYFSSFRGSWTTPTTAQWILLAIIIAAVASTRVLPPTSTDDRGKIVLSRERLSAASWLSVATVAAALALVGGPAFAALAAAFAAIVGVGLPKVVRAPRDGPVA